LVELITKGKSNPSGRKMFDRVILFGGTSEIGIGVANLSNEKLVSSQKSAITRLLRTKPSKQERQNYIDVHWSPTSSEEIISTVDSLAIGPSDLVVISIGDLSLDDHTAEELTYSVKHVEENLFSNGTLPILTLMAIANSMIKAGGGSVIVISSAAAFPVLDSNSIYSASKLMLDEISHSIARDLQRHQIQLMLVRPGFVPTKLHRRRSSSYLSTTTEAISKTVVKKLRRNSYSVVWIPKSWALVAWILTIFPFTRRIASRIMRKSRFTGK
jgi:decaprenylphospho-beta-D-erythro-pentofuranosid-2-ulose 2-reductase